MMYRIRKQTWWPAMALVMIGLSLYALYAPQWMAVQAAAQQADARLRQIAANLGIDPEQITDPEGWAAKEKAKAAKKREEALAEMRRYTHADEQEERALAAQLEAEAIMAAQPNHRIERELGKSIALGLTEEQAAAALGQVDPALDALTKAYGGQRQAKIATGPELVPERLQPVPFSAPAPRLWSPDGTPTPALKEFYASMRGQPGYVLAKDPSRDTRPIVGFPVLDAVPDPTADDLAQTPETVQTPEIQQLASSLGGKALALYNYVHTKIKSELYYGSKKGAHATLMEGGGNDFDQAALLITLLRASNIPARYEYGTVRLSLDQAKALTGGSDLSSAAYLLTSVGIPALGDGQTLLTERAWVLAQVPYSEYRGSGPASGDRLWVRLDPGLKRVARTQGVNLRGVVSFDFDGYLAQLNPRTPLEVFEGQLLAAAQARNLCNTLDDALDKAQVLEDRFRFLPAAHPAKVEASLLMFARPPVDKRHMVELRLGGAIKTFELAELQHKALGLRYVGATDIDQQAIAAAGGIVNVVPYMVRVTPVLRLDGVQVQAFDAVNPGTPQTLWIKVTLPNGLPAFTTHHVIAGAVYAVLISAGVTPSSRIDALRRTAQSATGEFGDNRIEAEAQLALALYAQRAENDATRLFTLQNHVMVKDVVEGLAGRDFVVRQNFIGIPVAMAPGNYLLDIGRESTTPLPKDGNTALVPSLNRLGGFQGSVLEHKVWELVFATESVSTVKALQAASSQQVPVYNLVPPNPPARANLQGYSDGTLRSVDNALAAGWTVTIPQRPINFQQYRTIEAYISLNPVTGLGAYIIGSSLNGSNSTGPMEGGGGGSSETSPLDSQTNQCGSIINMANGNWRESFTDLTLPAIGLPIVFTRSYASKATALTEIGSGWMHSYGMFLRPETDGFTYITEDWHEARFVRATGGYTRPPGWPITLTDLADGQRLRTKEGMIYEFNTSHQLRSIAEPSGNVTKLIYSNGLLSQVLDSNGDVALTFTHTGNKITGITDRAGRTVSFVYNGDDLVSATDVLGNTESYAYDAAHHLTSRTDKRGKVWLNFYDLRGRWVGSRDPLGNENSAVYDFVSLRTVFIDKTGAAWTKTYNAAGNPLSVVDPLGNREEMTWDADFNQLTHKDSRGFVTTMTYDGQKNLLSRTDPDNRVTSYTYESTFSRVVTAQSTGLPNMSYGYDTAGRMTSQTNGLGTTTYGYDARGQLSTVTAPGSVTTIFAYDTVGNVKTVTPPVGGATTLDYDNAGHLIKMTDGNQNSQTTVIDAAGRVTALIDARLARTEFTYDAAGNRLSIKDPAGAMTRFSYDDTGRLKQTTDVKGGVTQNEYDNQGRIVAQVDTKGARMLTRYDAAGRAQETMAADGALVSFGYCAAVGTSCSSGNCAGGSEPCCTIDALGNVTKKDFDSMGRLTTIADPLGRQTVQTYDTAGRLATISGPTQAPTQYSYDSSTGLLASVITSQLRVNYQYDARGNRTVVNAGGQQTTYTYDLANRLTSETNPIGNVTSYTYDPAGNRATKTDGNGKQTTYSYDPNRRLKTVTFQDGTQYQYDYDLRGNRILEQSPIHQRTLLYDELNRVQQVNDVTLNRTITYGYDANGNRTSLTEGSTNSTYTYDPLNRLRQAIDASGKPIVFDYDLAGRRIGISRPNGVRTAYTYDAAGQVTSILHTKDASVLLGFTYTYDQQGDRRTKVREDGTREAYTYDADHRLTEVQYGSTRRVIYGLTPQGNRESLTDDGNAFSSQFNNFNQLIQTTQTAPVSGQTTYAYDNNGNLLSETTGTSVKSYTWDLDNRLRQLVLSSGITDRFDYDANGLRIKKVDSTGTTKALVDGASILEEFDASNATINSYLNNPKLIDEILSFQQGGSVYYPLSDVIRSISAIADSKGTVVRMNSYDVYGEKVTSGTGPQIAFGFTGREHDDTGLRYHRNRYADPKLGRWNQPDSMDMINGPNLYQYGRSNPTVFTDPFGNYTEVIIWYPLINPFHLTSIVGHVSIRINDLSYSWEGNGINIAPWEAYLAANYYRDGAGLILNLTAAEEQKVEFYLRNSNSRYGGYNLITKNCGQVVGDALISSGFFIGYIRTITPGSLGRTIIMNADVIGSTYYTARTTFASEIENRLLSNAMRNFLSGVWIEDPAAPGLGF